MSYIFFLFIIVHIFKDKNTDKKTKENMILPLSFGLAFSPIVLPISGIIFVKNLIFEK